MLIFVTNKYLKKKHFGEVVRSFFLSLIFLLQNLYESNMNDCK